MITPIFIRLKRLVGKKKFILLFALFQCLILDAHYSFAQNSNLVFFTQGGEPFFVFLNGVRQNPMPANNIKIFGLEQMNYNLLVVIPHPGFGMANNSIRITPNKESVFEISKNNQNEYAIFPKGENPLSFTPSAPEQQMIKFVSQLPAAPAMPMGTGAGLNIMTGNMENTAATYTTTTTTTTVTNGNLPPPPQTNFLPGYNGPFGCPVPMTLQDFQNAKNTIGSKPFESSKISIAKQIAGTNCLFSSQVKEIMMMFSFEGTKIEFAKFAYGHTYDKGNYFAVTDAFDFDSSISELNKFIGR